MPNLRLNSFLYFERVHQHWINLIEKNLAKPFVLTIEGSLFRDVEAKTQNLEKMLSCLLVVSAELLPYDFDLNVHGLRSMIHRLVCLSTDTGVFDPALFRQRTEDYLGAPLSNDEALQQDLNEWPVVRDIAIILKGLPEILSRMKVLTDDILASKKYDVNYKLVASANEQLYRNVKSLEGSRCSIFR